VDTATTNQAAKATNAIARALRETQSEMWLRSLAGRNATDAVMACLLGTGLACFLCPPQGDPVGTRKLFGR
jgi:hypothetical protein